MKPRSKRNWDPWLKREYAESLAAWWGDPTNIAEWDPHKRERLTRVPHLIKGGSVLDVGCGHGHLYTLLKDRVDAYLGVDGPAQIAICCRHFPDELFKVGDVYDLSPFGVYDTVTAIQLFIHLPSLGPPLKQCWAHTKSRLILTMRAPHYAETKKQRPDGLIMHRYTGAQLAEAINSLRKVVGVSVFRSKFRKGQIIYVCLDRGKGPRKPIDHTVFRLGGMKAI